jgi:molybdenum cofactor biosynthesis enzyme MoaA
LTADGKIKTCLFSREEIDIKTPLRTGATKDDIIDIFRQSVAEKPSGHHLNAKDHQNVEDWVRRGKRNRPLYMVLFHF